MFVSQSIIATRERFFPCQRINDIQWKRQEVDEYWNLHSLFPFIPPPFFPSLFSCLVSLSLSSVSPSLFPPSLSLSPTVPLTPFFLLHRKQHQTDCSQNMLMNHCKRNVLIMLTHHKHTLLPVLTVSYYSPRANICSDRFPWMLCIASSTCLSGMKMKLWEGVSCRLYLVGLVSFYIAMNIDFCFFY